MNQPDSQTDPNPYLPPPVPSESGVRYAMPPMHWPRTIGLFVVLLLVGLPIYGLPIPLALAILLGGIRTALIFRGCRITSRLPPDYWGSTAVSTILCFLFQIVSAATFVGVCASIYSMVTAPIPNSIVIAITSLSAIAVFTVLYYLSIKIAVASRRFV